MNYVYILVERLLKWSEYKSEGTGIEADSVWVFTLHDPGFRRRRLASSSNNNNTLSNNSSSRRRRRRTRL